jgi:outer membrane protein
VVKAWLLLLLALASPCLAQEAPPAPTPVNLPALAPEPPEDTSQTLTIDLHEALEIALAKSPRVGITLARVRQTQAETDAAGAPLRPQAFARLLGPPVPPSLNSVSNNLAFAPLRVEARKILYDGGKVWAKIDQMKSQTASDAQSAQAEWHQINLDVRLAYIDLLRARAQLEVSGSGLKVTQQQLDESQKRFLAGEIPHGDVLLARVPNYQAQLDLQRAGATARDKQEALDLLLGLPLDTPLLLKPVDAAPPLKEDLAQCVLQARQDKPAIRASRLNLEAARHAIRAAELDNHPSLTGELGTVGYQNQGTYISGLGYYGALELNWAFFDGGLSVHTTASAKAARDAAELRLLELERESEVQVRQSYRAVESARQASESSAIQLTQSQDAYRIASAQYRAGLVPFYPVRQAQLDLLKAQQANSGALYDYLVARAQLDFARGETPDPDLSTPTVRP